jgi:lipoprotein-releasing system permease protein
LTSLFAWRYFKAPKSTNAINVIAWISVVAIAVVTAALIVVLSVFNGFEGLVKSLYNDFYSDLKIVPVKGKVVSLNTAQYKQIQQLDSVKFIEPIAEENAILLNGELRSIISLKGVSQTYEVASGLPKHVFRGKFEVGANDQPALVLGAGVENALGLIADRNAYPVTVYMPNRKATNMSDPLNALQSHNAVTTGAFRIQEDFDNGYAFTNLQFMQGLLQLDSTQYSSIEVFLTNEKSAEQTQEKLQKLLGDNYKVLNRFQLNQNLYSAMQIEKVIIYGVAVLILIIAAFNIVGSLTMLVLEKQKDIAVLQAIGANQNWVLKVFLKEGLLLALLGGGAGILLALLICTGQQTFHWVKLGGQSFIIDYYPIDMRLSDFAYVAIIIDIIGFFSAYVPSRKAVKAFVSLKG